MRYFLQVIPFLLIIAAVVALLRLLGLFFGWVGRACHLCRLRARGYPPVDTPSRLTPQGRIQATASPPATRLPEGDVPASDGGLQPASTTPPPPVVSVDGPEPERHDERTEFSRPQEITQSANPPDAAVSRVEAGPVLDLPGMDSAPGAAPDVSGPQSRRADLQHIADEDEVLPAATEAEQTAPPPPRISQPLIQPFESPEPAPVVLPDLEVSYAREPAGAGEVIRLLLRGKPADGYRGRMLVSWLMHDVGAGSYVVGTSKAEDEPRNSEVFDCPDVSVQEGWAEPLSLAVVDTNGLRAFARGRTTVLLKIVLRKLDPLDEPTLFREWIFELEVDMPQEGHGKGRQDRFECVRTSALLLWHVVRIPAAGRGVKVRNVEACRSAALRVSKLVFRNEFTRFNVVDEAMKQLVAPRLAELLKVDALRLASQELRQKVVEEADFVMSMEPTPAGEAAVKLIAHELRVPLES